MKIMETSLQEFAEVGILESRAHKVIFSEPQFDFWGCILQQKIHFSFSGRFIFNIFFKNILTKKNFVELSKIFAYNRPVKNCSVRKITLQQRWDDLCSIVVLLKLNLNLCRQGSTHHNVQVTSSNDLKYVILNDAKVQQKG